MEGYFNRARSANRDFRLLRTRIVRDPLRGTPDGPLRFEVDANALADKAGLFYVCLTDVPLEQIELFQPINGLGREPDEDVLASLLIVSALPVGAPLDKINNLGEVGFTQDRMLSFFPAGVLNFGANAFLNCRLVVD